ncbi:MAG: hypothetical protein MR762_14555 [Clostridiales bacterium]|nr:hypothetical protein [Clostridiales bacterium]
MAFSRSIFPGTRAAECGFIAGSAALVFLVSLLGVSEWLTPWINLVITIPLNFVLNEFWAFKA